MEQKVSQKVLEAFKRAVQKDGFTIEKPRYVGSLTVIAKNDIEVLYIMKNGLAFPSNPIIKSDQDNLNKLFLELREAHHLYENATPLEFKSVTDYRLVSAFGDFILAAKMDKHYDVNFTTWEYDYEHTGVIAGHYYDTNYNGAKQDFAIRAGLIDKDKLFEKEELSSIYEACVFRGRNDEDITYDSEKLLREVMDKVECNLPNQNEQEKESEIEKDIER